MRPICLFVVSAIIAAVIGCVDQTAQYAQPDQEYAEAGAIKFYPLSGPPVDAAVDYSQGQAVETYPDGSYADGGAVQYDGVYAGGVAQPYPGPYGAAPAQPLPNSPYAPLYAMQAARSGGVYNPAYVNPYPTSTTTYAVPDATYDPAFAGQITGLTPGTVIQMPTQASGPGEPVAGYITIPSKGVVQEGVAPTYSVVAQPGMVTETYTSSTPAETRTTTIIQPAPGYQEFAGADFPFGTDTVVAGEPLAAVTYPTLPSGVNPAGAAAGFDATGIRLVPAPDVPSSDRPNDFAPSQWFEIIRPGNGPIRIGRVTSSCVCVSPRVPNRHIAAGERALVEARIVSRPARNNLTYVLFVNVLEPVETMLDADVTISW